MDTNCKKKDFMKHRIFEVNSILCNLKCGELTVLAVNFGLLFHIEHLNVDTMTQGHIQRTSFSEKCLQSRKCVESITVHLTFIVVL